MIYTGENILANRIKHAFEKWRSETALGIGGVDYSYHELDKASDKIAAYLLLNHRGERFVGVWGEKLFFTYAAIVGIIKAGKVYVPLNPKFPPGRNQCIIDEAGLKFLFTPSDVYSDLFKELKINILQSEIQDGVCEPFQIEYCDYDPAYLLFTSGSTGKPKGVLINNHQLVHYLDAVGEFIQVTPGDCLSHTFDLTFDLSLHDIFLAFTNGAKLCVPGENDLILPSRYIKSNRLTHWFSVPTLLKLMSKLRQLKVNEFPDLKYAMFCGEALPADLALQFKTSLSDSAKVFNLYGPTEATIAVSSYQLMNSPKELDGNLCIGKIFSGNDYKIQSSGEINSNSGELLLKGEQVINSYFNSEYDERFFFKDQEGQLWYRTGDMVKADEHANLYFAGRKDSQIKLNGYRIELPEIESAICKLFSLANSCCFVDDTGGNHQLIAILETENEIQVNTLTSRLGELLPAYMIPKFFVFLNEFPLNSNQKIDRVELTNWYKNNYGKKRNH